MTTTTMTIPSGRISELVQAQLSSKGKIELTKSFLPEVSKIGVKDGLPHQG